MDQFGLIKDLNDVEYGPSKMQYDYLRAYLNFSVGGEKGSMDIEGTKRIVD